MLVNNTFAAFYPWSLVILCFLALNASLSFSISLGLPPSLILPLIFLPLLPFWLPCSLLFCLEVVVTVDGQLDASEQLEFSQVCSAAAIVF